MRTRWAVIVPLAVTVVAGLALAAPAQAAPSPADAAIEGGRVTVSARALTASEIRAKGLDRYVDMSKVREITPRVEERPGAVTPARKSASRAGVTAVGCWTSWFSYGTSQLYGRTDVNWCGDGTAVTYANSACSGYSSPWVPTYAYLSCVNYPNYGVGWNLYDVRTTYDLCPVYVPGWGSCVQHAYPWLQYQFLANGRVVRVGGW